MDKKITFQKKLLNSQLTENTIIVSKLENKCHELGKQLDTINSNLTINTDLHTIQNKILSLEQQKSTYKNTMIFLTHKISKCNKEIEEIPQTIINDIKNEHTILTNELERIDIEMIECINQNKEEIDKAKIEKQILLTKINNIKQDIYSNDTDLSELQLKLHYSRKIIINDLKKMKHSKTNLKNEIIINKERLNLFTEELIILKENNIELEHFKALLIDAEYNLEHNIIQLTEYHNKFNIMNTLVLNETLTLINTIITNNTNQIDYINKTIIKLNINNTSFANAANNEINSKNHSNIIPYKDNYKLFKQKKKELQTILDQLLNTYNNYETLIINKINYKYKEISDILECDSKKAKERFNIINIRINKESETNKIKLDEEIINTKLELKDTEISISKTSQYIKNLKIHIETKNTINIELLNLEITINKHKTIIKQIETDLSSLN